ncbi:MAG: trypsin-like peptidase domain-containing protein, partial [Deltaproteobacteria bacterium]|nr:trypsin-like peptidase domain-containing protein [Deltaproteobacteria bacterium]
MLTARFGLTPATDAENFWKEPSANIKKEEGLPTLLNPNSFIELAKTLGPVVVNISTTQVVREKPRVPFPEFRGPCEDFFGDEFFRFFDEFPQREFKRQSLGSGFIINKEGYILTNNHVVEDAEEILVTLSDKREYKAKVIGRDSRLDLGLVKIDAKDDLPVAILGDSDKLQIGEWVMAIGNPFALSHTVTAGIVSAKGRVIGAGPYDNFIQTDASINPGNSGGPLFNLRGEVIGINTAIIAGGQGIGFALPINMAKEVLSQLKEKGKVTRGWIGVSIQDVTPELARSFGLKEKHGALVSSAMKDDPADKAGIRPGDIIVE